MSLEGHFLPSLANAALDADAANCEIVERAEWVDMARAEFESQQALAAVIPDNVIAPTAWGLFRDNPAKAFYLCRFRSLRPQVPPLSDFLDIVKRLHRNSVSPTGKFGFHCVCLPHCVCKVYPEPRDSLTALVRQRTAGPPLYAPNGPTAGRNSGDVSSSTT